MNTLGIYYKLYGDAPMTVSRALLITAVGFLLVFAVLAIIAMFVKLMGYGFDKKIKKTMLQNDMKVTDIPEKGTPLPDNESQGNLVLTDVSEEEAALIMAIVSNQSGVPLNRLQFNSIKLLEEDK
ncbi:MAG: OadG family protein [Oscillospiraceae bacterium]|nr:OadG family protein [Oscillospiraceae bacterium]